MSDEVEKAKQQAAVASSGPTVFDKILSGEWSSDKVYEDDKCLAFFDINPQAPVHIILIPKTRGNLTQLSLASSNDKELLGHLLYVAQLVEKEHCEKGFRIVINDGQHGAQSVYHLHLHILGGRQMMVRTVRVVEREILSFLSIVCVINSHTHSIVTTIYIVAAWVEGASEHVNGGARKTTTTHTPPHTERNTGVSKQHNKIHIYYNYTQSSKPIIPIQNHRAYASIHP